MSMNIDKSARQYNSVRIMKRDLNDFSLYIKNYTSRKPAPLPNISCQQTCA